MRGLGGGEDKEPVRKEDKESGAKDKEYKAKCEVRRRKSNRGGGRQGASELEEGQARDVK